MKKQLFFFVLSSSLGTSMLLNGMMKECWRKPADPAAKTDQWEKPEILARSPTAHIIKAPNKPTLYLDNRTLFAGGFSTPLASNVDSFKWAPKLPILAVLHAVAHQYKISLFKFTRNSEGMHFYHTLGCHDFAGSDFNWSTKGTALMITRKKTTQYIDVMPRATL